MLIDSFNQIALHELDPQFRKVTLENEQLRKLVRDLKFHCDPVGELHILVDDQTSDNHNGISALQSMVIFKQPEIGGEGQCIVQCTRSRLIPALISW
jgi:hypothetical protein